MVICKMIQIVFKNQKEEFSLVLAKFYLAYTLFMFSKSLRVLPNDRAV